MSLTSRPLPSPVHTFPRVASQPASPIPPTPPTSQVSKRQGTVLAHQFHAAQCLRRALDVWRGAVAEAAREEEGKLQLAVAFAFENTLGERGGGAALL